MTTLIIARLCIPPNNLTAAPFTSLLDLFLVLSSLLSHLHSEQPVFDSDFRFKAKYLPQPFSEGPAPLLTMSIHSHSFFAMFLAPLLELLPSFLTLRDHWTKRRSHLCTINCQHPSISARLCCTARSACRSLQRYCQQGLVYQGQYRSIDSTP